ncbi:hypothetical protein [Streptomyces sp. NPDC020996]
MGHWHCWGFALARQDAARGVRRARPSVRSDPATRLLSGAEAA